MKTILATLSILAVLLALVLAPAARAEINAGPPYLVGTHDASTYGLVYVYGYGFTRDLGQPVTISDPSGAVLASTVKYGKTWLYRVQLATAPCVRSVVASARYPGAPASDIAFDITIPLGDPAVVAQNALSAADLRVQATQFGQASFGEYMDALAAQTAARVVLDAAIAQDVACGYTPGA